MTWGPFVASSVVGGLAVWGWWSARPWGYLGWDAPQSHVEAWARAREKYPLGITQRVALILLASDVCMLLFVPWPGVQAWQGRAAAMAVSVVQIVWLIKERKRHGN
jgi:acyl-CoA thioesterase